MRLAIKRTRIPRRPIFWIPVFSLVICLTKLAHASLLKYKFLPVGSHIPFSALNQNLVIFSFGAPFTAVTQSRKDSCSFIFWRIRAPLSTFELVSFDNNNDKYSNHHYFTHLQEFARVQWAIPTSATNQSSLKSGRAES